MIESLKNAIKSREFEPFEHWLIEYDIALLSKIRSFKAGMWCLSNRTHTCTTGHFAKMPSSVVEYPMFEKVLKLATVISWKCPIVHGLLLSARICLGDFINSNANNPICGTVHAINLHFPCKYSSINCWQLMNNCNTIYRRGAFTRSTLIFASGNTKSWHLIHTISVWSQSFI